MLWDEESTATVINQLGSGGMRDKQRRASCSLKMNERVQFSVFTKNAEGYKAGQGKNVGGFQFQQTFASKASCAGSYINNAAALLRQNNVRPSHLCLISFSNAYSIWTV